MKHGKTTADEFKFTYFKLKLKDFRTWTKNYETNDHFTNTMPLTCVTSHEAVMYGPCLSPYPAFTAWLNDRIHIRWAHFHANKRLFIKNNWARAAYCLICISTKVYTWIFETSTQTVHKIHFIVIRFIRWRCDFVWNVTMGVEHWIAGTVDWFTINPHFDITFSWLVASVQQ